MANRIIAHDLCGLTLIHFGNIFRLSSLSLDAMKAGQIVCSTERGLQWT
jgi:hypothetical protein